MSKPFKVPVFKEDSKIDITLSTHEISAIVQAIFMISENWNQEDVDNLKKTLEERKLLEDPRQITFVLLDGVYRRILQKGKELDLLEEKEFAIPGLDPDVNP